MKEKKFVGFTLLILVNRNEEVFIMQYVEMTVEEAKKCCNKNTKVLVAIQDLEDNNVDAIFVPKRRNEYDDLFADVETVASLCDDFVKQLKLFTEKQDIKNIRPFGLQKIVLLRE